MFLMLPKFCAELQSLETILNSSVDTNSTKMKLGMDVVEIAYVEEYNYLGQVVAFQARQDKEITWHVDNAWRSYLLM